MTYTAVNAVKKSGDVMKKWNKKVNNLLYALVYELVFIPILAYASFIIYSKLMLVNFISDNLVFNALLIIILVSANIFLVYYIAYILNHLFKFELEYQIVVGLVIIFIAVWFKLYYSSLESSLCGMDGQTGCLDAINNNKGFTSVLIFIITYNLLYIPIHILVRRKGKKVKVDVNTLKSKKK